MRRDYCIQHLGTVYKEASLEKRPGIDQLYGEAIGLAREIVVSKRSATFRAASLAVIGLNGDASDRPLLEKYPTSSDIRLRVAATEALKNLNHGIH